MIQFKEGILSNVVPLEIISNFNLNLVLLLGLINFKVWDFYFLTLKNN